MVGREPNASVARDVGTWTSMRQRSHERVRSPRSARWTERSNVSVRWSRKHDHERFIVCELDPVALRLTSRVQALDDWIAQGCQHP